MSSLRLFGALSKISQSNIRFSNKSRCMSSVGDSKHFKLKVVDNIGVITIDSPGVKVNSLNDEVMSELERLLPQIDSNPQIQACVMISAKPGCFIAGADIGMIEQCKTVEETTQKSKEGQRILQKVEDSKKPFVAAIAGSCLGGGMETALAAHYRIAVKDRKTNLGLPEVMLGLLPEAKEVEATGDKYFNMNVSREVYIRILQSGKADEPDEKIDAKPKIEEVSSIKARMIEKQRAAVQKRGCEDYVLTCSEMPASGIERCFKKSMNIEKNSIPACVFLIKDILGIAATSTEEDPNFHRSVPRHYLIKLKYVSNGRQIPINDWLRELSPKVHLDKEKLRHIYIDNDKRFEFDFTTKLILLKLSFEEIVLSEESFELQSRKRKLSSSNSPTAAAPVDKTVDEKLNYMGNNPEIVWRSVEEGLEEV
ncbi:unnamed protein product [Callosobruchus maculatus]|uniref:3-hydroxyacyl-CoA dehydrogenase NAD binding domain-containing protein n=1 Tax=Callosobruchus maculatus TaxID=64391 RepID=A0A653CHR0_CALMS|nr:unnamed protein product [Callosobruchus maculatus]